MRVELVMLFEAFGEFFLLWGLCVLVRGMRK